MTRLAYLECSRCASRYEPGKPWGLCECGGPLLARYDLENLRAQWKRDSIRDGPSNMWRYAPALPIAEAASIVSLGEGMTPLLCAPRLGAKLGGADLWIKDDGINPTGTFKARGMSCAISMCVELGVKKIAVPSAGNAAGAAAAPRPASKVLVTTAHRRERGPLRSSGIHIPSSPDDGVGSREQALYQPAGTRGESCT